MGHDILVFSKQALYSMQTPNAVTRYCQVNETQESSGNSKDIPHPRIIYFKKISKCQHVLLDCAIIQLSC